MRHTLKHNFLKKHNLHEHQRMQLKKDASYRAYERLITEGDAKNFVLMDAPPEKEDVKPFIHIANFLIKNNFSAPEVLLDDIENGFLLLEDFGDETYTKILSGQSYLSKELDEITMYEKAIDALIQLHKIDHRDIGLQDYDENMLIKESMRFIEYYLETLNCERVSKAQVEEYVIIWKHLLNISKVFGKVVVLRDYHADNLMWLEDRRGARKVGILDFQDAVIGSPLYDIVSLLEDARRDVSEEVTEKMIQRYLQAFPTYPRKELMAVLSILGAQRNLKIIGFCAAQATKHKNPYYLTLLPRVWRHLNKDLKHPLLLPLKKWLIKLVPIQMNY